MSTAYKDKQLEKQVWKIQTCIVASSKKTLSKAMYQQKWKSKNVC